ncbi:ATP-dependent RNA helicase DDX60 [Nematocida minor]|uniref:ATP-dependent RNA helicase DDX60 n=1 Tax=Nematocida minor TaxID=1912983 RepID=UPI0022208ACC|nr:ATP-dependent RNA helicase DDX60 [Nematocida minor]XP_051332099.1 ATP-dependent RNA helicase DDX60 [Nematocida minor]KAI5188829.1 ATP-dependent RNA helicase DDX60 [Nematocida minor]KAI5188933.1 ATP-dependent RNA helicase DDX60 [Nematocida minor]
MKKEMPNIYKEWYANMPTQMIDVSESFVGIGKMVINGHSIYRYIEDVYKIKSSTLPLKLLDTIADTIGHSLKLSGFKDSYIVLFHDEEETAERSICMREVIAALEKSCSIKTIWFHSLQDKEFRQFLKEEHICIGVAYQNTRSLVFLNTILGLSLYAGVLDKETFRAPRLFMFVTNPSNYLYGVEYITKEYPVVKMESAEKAQEAAETIIKKHLGESVYEAHKEVLSEKRCFSRYSRKEEPVSTELIKEIASAIKTAEVCSLKDMIDGCLLNPEEAQTEKAESVEEGKEKPRRKSVFIPTSLSSVKFYNEEQERSFRTEQMYIESLKKTAQSLHEGKHLHNPITLVTDKTKKKKEKETKEKLSKKQLEIIEKNKKQKELESKKKDIAFLKSFKAKYESFSVTYEKRRHLESFLPRIHSSFICRKVLLLNIEFYDNLWSLEKRKKVPNKKDLVSLYMNCVSFIEKYAKESSIEELQFAMQRLLDHSFESTVLEMCKKYSISYINKKDPSCTEIYDGCAPVSISFTPGATGKPNDNDISFLMQHAGDKLKRSLNSQEDPRLLFKPDGWQFDLLEIVDANQSAVICAPTSSGKTFICYYAMEKVLRESNDGIVIFVAPTKALVNQVAADVYARFGSKPYIKQSNILQGICMSDFQISPFTCQVLITVPPVLEKILTMPPEPSKKGHPYLDRIRYIVIDEVHKISDSKIGSSMEKIIHFSPCPLLLLSATIGNLHEFFNWIKKIEEKKNRVCNLVVHKERYCEIKNYIFVPKEIKALENCHKTTREAGEKAIAQIHSLFAYSFRGIKEEGFSNDVNFLPDELLNLYYAVYAVLKNDSARKHLAKQFMPRKFFKTNCITKGDVKKYEKYVIETFQKMIKTNELEPQQVTQIYEILVRDAKEGFQKIDDDLKNRLDKQMIEAAQKEKNNEELMKAGGKKTVDCKKVFAESEEAELTKSVENMEIKKTEISPDILLYNTDYLLDNVLDLVVELEAADKLPCIVFNLERTVCNSLAIRLSEELEKFEKCAPPAFSKTDLRENEKILKEMRRARDATVATGKDSWISESIVAEEASGRIIDPNAKDPRFCFTDPTISSSGAYLLDEYAKSLRKTGRLDPRLIQALYRGIGVHHSGIPKKYRNMVEILFRMKQLRVIFATETLALGINMPCRTAVFAGDSLLLDSMSFKQMAGRAGRRGYDTQGNVVFFGISKQKVRSLITSYLPYIKGEYPYTSLLAIQSARPTVKDSSIESIVTCPLTSISLPKEGSEEETAEESLKLKEQTESILAAQKEHLVQKMFLSPEVLTLAENMERKLAHTSSLCDMGLNSLSYGAESFVFMSLVNEGVLDAICNQKKDKEEIARDIILLVSYIFEIYPLPSTSELPTLPAIDPAIFSILDRYYKESIKITKRFMKPEELEWLALVPERVHYTPVSKSFLLLPYLYTKKSNYILRYFIDQNVKQILRSSGMGETELWQRLKSIEDILTQLQAYYKTYNATSISMPFVDVTYTYFQERFAKMHA